MFYILLHLFSSIFTMLLSPIATDQSVLGILLFCKTYFCFMLQEFLWLYFVTSSIYKHLFSKFNVFCLRFFCIIIWYHQLQLLKTWIFSNSCSTIPSLSPFLFLFLVKCMYLLLGHLLQATFLQFSKKYSCQWFLSLLVNRLLAKVNIYILVTNVTSIYLHYYNKLGCNEFYINFRNYKGS